MPAARRSYKDTLFRHLFGRYEHRANALELYNALSGKSHSDPSKIEITTIDDFIYLGYRNDVSFLIDDEMVLLEHQSTHNPNMPLRGLLYFAKLFTKYIDEHKIDLYGSGKLSIPTPRFAVLYFGTRKRPDREIMSLSSLFSSGPGDIEVTVTVLNCNEGRNEDIMGASETLRGYAHLLALVRGKEACGFDLRDAVDDAVDECIAEGILEAYLTSHRVEAKDMLFTMEYEERAQEIHREAIAREAREQGYKEGHDEGYAAGRDEGYSAGRDAGFSAGRDAGFSAGRDAGFSAGRDEGLEQGIEQEREHIKAVLMKAGIDPAILEE